MHTKEIENIVKAVLSTPTTNYELAKSLGYSNPASVKYLREGTHSVKGIKLERLEDYERYYKEAIEGGS